jgi:cytochrome c oxidase cbb3-type subunit III
MRLRPIRAGFLFITLATAPAQDVKKPTNPLGNSPAVVAAGRKLYNTSCTMCHGADGEAGDRGPALADNRRYFRLSEAAIFDAVKNGIPNSPMPALGLPDDDVWRIVAFIRNLRATASDNNVPGDVDRGRRVFEQKGRCLECHTIRGQGGLIGPDLSNVGAERSLNFIRDALTRDRPPQAGYRPVKIVLADGSALEGIAKNEDAYSLQVLGRDEKLYLLVREEVREVIRGGPSLMPKNYDLVLGKDEFQDLLAFLSRQVRHKVAIVRQGENEVGR